MKPWIAALLVLATSGPAVADQAPELEHVLRVEAPGLDRIPIEGYYAFDDETPLVHVEGVTTPFTVKARARRVCARFRSLDPDRPIVLLLRKPKEKWIGHVAKVPAVRAELRWSPKRRGPRRLGDLEAWSVPLSCEDVAAGVPPADETTDRGSAGLQDEARPDDGNGP